TSINDETSFRATVLGEGDGVNERSRGMIENVLEFQRPQAVITRDQERVEGLEDIRKSEESTD
ncbi:hypothetical protein PQX77_009073, partial [Marasmius sp. AFHP31]